MNKIAKGIAIGMVSISLVGCTAITNFLSLINTATGQAFISALGVGGSLIPGIQQVIADIDNGISSTGAVTALHTVCYALPWTRGAVDFFGASAGMTATTIAEVDTAVAAFIAGPCTTPPSNLAQVISQGAGLFIAIENDLKNGGIPVVVPVSKTLVRTVF